MQTPQADLPWLPIVAIAGSLLGGGMMGSIITLLVTNYRNRRQPVGYSIEIIDVFKQNPELPSLRAMLQFPLPEESGEVYGSIMLANLSIIRVKVTNKGNQDFAEFKMGMTLEDETEAFNTRIETLDRHHIGEVLTPVDYENPTNELDFALKPFNRSEAYTINTYVTYKKAVGEIRLGSPHSTRFVEIGSLNEIRGPELAIQSGVTGIGAILLALAGFLYSPSGITSHLIVVVAAVFLGAAVTAFVPLRILFKK